MKGRGLFITIEGGEGVGKSTNLTFLANFLIANGVDVVTTREPGGTRLGEEIRELLLQVRSEPISSMAELFLIFAARAQHLHDVIEPALRAGKWVISDRFTDATYAYQCGGRGVDHETVRCLEKLVQGELRPDFTLLLDVSVAVGMSRARNRAVLDRFERESEDFFERVRSSYLEAARSSGGRYHVFNAGRPLADVQQELLQFAGDVLSRWIKGQAD